MQNYLRLGHIAASGHFTDHWPSCHT